MFRISLVLSLFVLATCQEEADLKLSKPMNEFQIDFLKELTKKTSGNIFCSGFSLSTALSMLLAGARGDTEREIRNTLGYANLTDGQIRESYHQLLTNLRGEHSSYELNVANGLWIQEGGNILEAFKDIVQRVFYAEEEQVNFASSLATDQINQWVSNQTKGKIPKLFDEPLSANTHLVLANAMYFKGAWEHPFLKDLTSKSPFYLNGTEESLQVDMMPMSRHFLHVDSEDLNAQIVSLPYKNDEVSMLVILPKDNTGINDLERELTAEKLDKAISEMTEKEVSLFFPKFNVSSTFELGDILKAMGIHKAFDAADFSGITGDNTLFVSSATQKAVVEVNEEGTVAAVVTDFIMELSAKPDMVFFTVNKPFLFAIRHKQSKIILFMGKIVNPLK